ncbi:AP2-like ethylene-responsive transcription factor AIL5-like protein [Drosera capensis]
MDSHHHQHHHSSFPHNNDNDNDNDVVAEDDSGTITSSTAAASWNHYHHPHHQPLPFFALSNDAVSTTTSQTREYERYLQLEQKQQPAFVLSSPPPLSLFPYSFPCSSPAPPGPDHQHGNNVCLSAADDDDQRMAVEHYLPVAPLSVQAPASAFENSVVQVPPAGPATAAGYMYDDSEQLKAAMTTTAAATGSCFSLHGFMADGDHDHTSSICGVEADQVSPPALLGPPALMPRQEDKKSIVPVDHSTFGHRIGGQEDMKLIYGIIVAEGKAKPERAAKYCCFDLLLNTHSYAFMSGYDEEEKAARAYDLAALKYWGPITTTNFPISDYEKELEEMRYMTRHEFVASLRRKSSGFSRGASIYRGVTRHHQHGRWQARIGRVAGNKDLYLGTFSTQEEAAEAYDIASIKFRGLNAVTNFDINRYDVQSIANHNLPVGGCSSSKPASSDAGSAIVTLAAEDASKGTDVSLGTTSTFDMYFSIGPIPVNGAANYGLFPDAEGSRCGGYDYERAP